MYVYDDFDRTLVAERVTEFGEQVAGRLSGELTEDEFRPLRLMNGVYLQLHAYMLRVRSPTGRCRRSSFVRSRTSRAAMTEKLRPPTTRQHLQFKLRSSCRIRPT